MTKDLQSYLKMSVTEESHVLNNLGICSSLPEFTPRFAVVQGSNKLINDILVKLEGSKYPDTITKMKYREELTEECMNLTRKMQAYAVVNKLNDLQLSISYSKSQLKKNNDKNLITICNAILEKAEKHQANLGAYGITAATIANLKQTIIDFTNFLPKSKLDKTEKINLRINLKNTITSLRNSWNYIDMLMEIIRDDYTDFYNEYQLLRKTEHSRTSSIDLIIKTFDKQIGTVLPFVNLSLIPADSLLEEKFNQKANLIEKKTRKYGCYLKNLDEGNYILTARKAGYKDATKTISFAKGEYTTVNIVMEKL